MDNKQWINENTARIDALTKRLESSTLVDVTDTTATAPDVASGKVFYNKDGVKTEGTYAIKLQEKTANENGEVIPDAGYDGLSKVVVNVESGGGGDIGTGNYYLKVIDYDGTILDEKRLNTGDTYTLPNPPSHDGLVFQSWSCSQEIVDGVITITDNNVMVGATYTTTSGLSEFDITLTKATGLYIYCRMNGTKDWGDGTSGTENYHTYADYGDYTITCDGTPSSYDYNGGIFVQNSSNRNYFCKSIRLGENFTSIPDYTFTYCQSLKSVVIPNSVTSVGNYMFYDCYSLKSVVIPDGITSIGRFGRCYSLKSVVIPNSVTSVGNYMFQDCHSLKSVVIPDGITSIPHSFLSQCYQLTSIAIPNSVTNIDDRAFYNCYLVTKYDFTQSVTIPTLGGTEVFTGFNKICKIYVPDELYDEWIVATNWVTYANYIYKASEMPTG